MEKLVILRGRTSVPDGNLELFIGDNANGEVHVINMNKQLEWLNIISSNIRTSNRDAH